jgi:hypothetical protein
MSPSFLAVAAALASALVSGCAATTTAVAKRNLDVQTSMSDTIFLEPVTPAHRTVYVDVRNTSDKPDLDLAAPIKERIAARGYRVVDDPAQAHFMLQANVLQAGRSSQTATEAAFKGGFGGTLLGGAAGGAVGYGIGKAGGGSDILLGAGGAILGAAIESVSGALVQDVTYSVITDLQVSERPTGETVSQTTSGELRQGRSTTTTQTSHRTSEMRRYQTRIVSKANKANLEWQEAAPQLIDGLTRSVAGLF